MFFISLKGLVMGPLLKRGRGRDSITVQTSQVPLCLVHLFYGESIGKH